MLKVLIYSSKKIYDNSSYEGRAEADLIAYRDGDYYVVLKNKTTQYIPEKPLAFTLERIINRAERDLWRIEKDKYV